MAPAPDKPGNGLSKVKNALSRITTPNLSSPPFKMPLGNFTKKTPNESCPPVATHLRHYQDDMGETSPRPPEEATARPYEKLPSQSSGSSGSSGSGSQPKETTAIPYIRKARQRLGLHPVAPIDPEHNRAPHSRLWWSQIRIILREPLSEFWGTLVLVLFGTCSIAQILLSTGYTSGFGPEGLGQHALIAAGWGVGNMLGVYVAGDSGAYLNPAVTFTFCLYRKLPWRRLPIMFAAQLLGAFCAAALTYLAYHAKILEFESGQHTVPPAANATAGIFAVYPQPGTTTLQQFGSEVISSATLLFIKFAFKDKTNMGEKKDERWFPQFLFFLLFGINGMFGWEGSYAMNPARDLGPRILSCWLGYGRNVWTTFDYYFWIPLVVPFLGGAFGGWLYDVSIYTGESPVNTPWMGLERVFWPVVVRDWLEKRKKERGTKRRSEAGVRDRDRVGRMV